MQKQIAATILILTAAAGCSRPAPPPSRYADIAAELSGPGPGIEGSRTSIANLEAIVLPRISVAESISAGVDSGWLAGRAALETLMAESFAAPATGLAAQLVAYLGRADAAALPPQMTIGRLPGISLLPGRAAGKARVYVAGPALGPGQRENQPTWRIAVLQWQEAGRVRAAIIPGETPSAFRMVQHKGKQVLLTFSYSRPGLPLVVSAFRLGDGRLTPTPLPYSAAGTPQEIFVSRMNEASVSLRGVGNLTYSHPEYRWACLGDRCVSLDWTESGLTVRPVFSAAEAQRELARGEPAPDPGWDAWAEQIQLRLAAPGAASESHLALAARVGAQVNLAKDPESTAEARVYHISGQTVVDGAGQTYARNWLQWKGEANAYAVAEIPGGEYIEHRVIRDSGKTYIVVLTEAEPQPATAYNNMDIYAVEGPTLSRLNLPKGLRQMGGYKSFLGLDGHRLLQCDDGVDLSGCQVLRWENGAIAVESGASLAGKPSGEAMQVLIEARALLGTAAFEESLTLLQQVLEMAPGYAEAWTDLSVLYQRMWEWPAAARAAETALRLDPAYAPAHYQAGLIAGVQGRPDRGIQHLKQATTLNPKHLSAWIALGRFREQVGDWRNALFAYEQATALDPSSAEAEQGVRRAQARMNGQ